MIIAIVDIVFSFMLKLPVLLLLSFWRVITRRLLVMTSCQNHNYDEIVHNILYTELITGKK